VKEVVGTFINSTDFIKMAAFQELKEALQIKKVNDELLEYLASSLRWILRYAQRNNMDIPDKEKIISLMDMAMEIENKLPPTTTDFQQRIKQRMNQQNQNV
jgi:hypothetical protein